MCNNVKLEILAKYEICLMKNIMLHDLLKFHFKLMILFHITFICTLYDIVLPNKYLSIYLASAQIIINSLISYR